VRNKCKFDTLSSLQWQHQCESKCQYLEEASTFSWRTRLIYSSSLFRVFVWVSWLIFVDFLEYFLPNFDRSILELRWDLFQAAIGCWVSNFHHYPSILSPKDVQSLSPHYVHNIQPIIAGELRHAFHIHTSTTDQLEAQFFFLYWFIPILYMSQATKYSSSPSGRAV